MLNKIQLETIIKKLATQISVTGFADYCYISMSRTSPYTITNVSHQHRLFKGFVIHLHRCFLLCVFNRFDLTFSIQNFKKQKQIKRIVVDLPSERSVAATVSGRWLTHELCRLEDCAYFRTGAAHFLSSAGRFSNTET